MVLQSVLSLRALSMPDPGNVAMENLPINGGLTGKIIYKWWIFQHAMFDYRRVPLWPSLGCPVSVGTGVFCSKDMALVSWKQLIDPRGWCCFDVGIPKQIVVVISHLLLCILIIYIYRVQSCWWYMEFNLPFFWGESYESMGCNLDCFPAMVLHPWGCSLQLHIVPTSHFGILLAGFWLRVDCKFSIQISGFGLDLNIFKHPHEDTAGFLWE